MSSRDDEPETSYSAFEDESDRNGESNANENSTGIASRDVVVPLQLYKIVTVFSTMFAVFTVVGGFIALDFATNRASAPISEVNYPLAIFGLLLIVAGTVVYAFSTRFRAEGMGKSKDDSDEPSNNG
ncbi:hypothetical protein SAMN05421858_1067 [Haladaptatus litoreus]|uniref:DUF7315 domain-containing protein n=1 Tax=Haladaptatus litoreus TaxID=553468 RepID=A0A1N6XB59_9EURY|nr:hypothetical protein [Haladaptatus litoreus]SIQ99598.1 hypothetical protein SAMN05421858_1067 [Haladaptatus litoreus]